MPSPTVEEMNKAEAETREQRETRINEGSWPAR